MPRTLESVAVELVAELVRQTEARVEAVFAEALERELAHLVPETEYDCSLRAEPEHTSRA